jgi:hypothetical protein
MIDGFWHTAPAWAHPFMTAVAYGLAERNIATLRHQSKLAQATVRSGVEKAI